MPAIRPVLEITFGLKYTILQLHILGGWGGDYTCN